MIWANISTSSGDSREEFDRQAAQKVLEILCRRHQEDQTGEMMNEHALLQALSEAVQTQINTRRFGEIMNNLVDFGLISRKESGLQISYQISERGIQFIREHRSKSSDASRQSKGCSPMILIVIIAAAIFLISRNTLDPPRPYSLQIGDRVRLAEYTAPKYKYLRDHPGVEPDYMIQNFPDEAVFEISDGPRKIGNINWWKLDNGSKPGWLPERTETGKQILIRIK